MKRGYLPGICSYKSQTYNECFKPSTKEAFDAQNKPIKKWSVGSYVVFLKDNLQANFRKRGDISEITHVNVNTDNITFRDGICNSINGEFSVVTNLKWFATKSEAEEFAKTLVGPLKQAVHCTTQKEWDFVTEKLGNDGINWFKDPDWGNNKSFCISFEGKNQSQTLDFYINAGHQILSFQEWCDLNGYKMEKEVKFEVGKWYEIIHPSYCKHEHISKFKEFKNNCFYYSEKIIRKQHKFTNDYHIYTYTG